MQARSGYDLRGRDLEPSFTSICPELILVEVSRCLEEDRRGLLLSSRMEEEEEDFSTRGMCKFFLFFFQSDATRDWLRSD